MNYDYINVIKLRFTISLMKTKTNSCNRTAIHEDTDALYCRPPNFTKEGGQQN